VPVHGLGVVYRRSTAREQFLVGLGSPDQGPDLFRNGARVLGLPLPPCSLFSVFSSLMRPSTERAGDLKYSVCI
jgi:hypothetical protein